MHAVIIISAGAEWRAALPLFPDARLQSSPLGDWFEYHLPAPPLPDGDDEAQMINDAGYRVIVLHGGWGKIAAASSAQYAISRWAPPLIVNLGTCGGFRGGGIERNEVILAEKTIVYDLVEQMTDPAEALAHYTTTLDLGWLPAQLPLPVRRGLVLTADRDLSTAESPALRERFGGLAADWESGAIAWVAARHGVRCLILRGVSDLVGPEGGEAYHDGGQFFAESSATIMKTLVPALPAWIQLNCRRP